MARVDDFIKLIYEQFPNDRLTWQKGIPTFHPENADETSQLFKLANSHKQRLYITGYGNNIDPIGQTFDEVVSVRTDRLNKLHEINEADYFVEVGAGYPLREINLALKSHALYLPHSGLPYVGSVGGALAVALSSDYHGIDFPLKKYFVRCETVTPTGEIVRPGSSCFKSVAGYDVARLFAGSWGLLGLIVKATFRVMPISAEVEYESMRQKAVDRSVLMGMMAESNQETDALYSRKIKMKFDPENILPVVGI